MPERAAIHNAQFVASVAPDVKYSSAGNTPRASESLRLESSKNALALRPTV
jgi:hypothetical protein